MTTQTDTIYRDRRTGERVYPTTMIRQQQRGVVRQAEPVHYHRNMKATSGYTPSRKDTRVPARHVDAIEVEMVKNGIYWEIVAEGDPYPVSG